MRTLVLLALLCAPAGHAWSQDKPKASLSAQRSVRDVLNAAKGKPVKEEDNASEFELALDEDDSASEIEVESGSEVVALDEEEGEEYDEAESDYDGYDDEPTASAGAVGAVSGAAVAAEPAPWPAWMVVPLVFTTIAMCLGGIVVVEVMRNAFTYQDGMPIGGTLASAEWLKSFAGFFGGGK